MSIDHWLSINICLMSYLTTSIVVHFFAKPFHLLCTKLAIFSLSLSLSLSLSHNILRNAVWGGEEKVDSVHARNNNNLRENRIDWLIFKQLYQHLIMKNDLFFQPYFIIADEWSRKLQKFLFSCYWRVLNKSIVKLIHLLNLPSNQFF